VLQEQPPGVRLATSYCLCDLKRSKSNRSASMVTIYKLENLQMGVFSEVRQKICQGPELSVLTSVANNQSFMRRPPRLRKQVCEVPPADHCRLSYLRWRRRIPHS
jgi:hypothetical protein